MNPAIIIFGFGIGAMVGMTGMGGGTLMTPLLILLFGVKPVTAIGTDIFYAAVTKTVGGWRHLKMGTVNMSLALWLAAGSVPASVAGVWAISILQSRIGEEKLDSLVYALLGGTLLMVGFITLARALILSNLVEEREDFEIKRRHKIAAVAILWRRLISKSSRSSTRLLRISARARVMKPTISRVPPSSA